MKSVAEQLAVIRRGTVHIIPEDALEAKLAEGRPLRVKLGVDPTAPDIHFGHTVVLHKLRQFQDLGHHAVLIIGDYTAMIGDPSGRSATRQQLTREDVARAAATYQEQVFKVLDRGRVELVWNGSWFSKFSFEEVITLCSRYTVARMLERDDFAKRMREERPIGVHEFLYPLMQAHDSVEVRADVELGGTDQIFNVLLGRHLQREAGQPEQVAVITPILEGTDGVQKMSKSLGNYIGIAEPPNDMFGKVMSISDALMLRYFELLTNEDVASLRAQMENGSLHPMRAKQQLAHHLVARVYDDSVARHAAEEFARRFQRHELPSDVDVFDWPEASVTSVGLPQLLLTAGLAASMSDARRLIRQGAVRLNGERVSDIAHRVVPDDTGSLVVHVGSRRVRAIRFLR